ncbi:uncharacterized protein [Macrobrachium rosenbergii]|uniref:uncharacterized protein n=1 Tax=Macrobrachium rosenbergii TaxID=79674 RepID=UPI0034D451FE
MEGGVASEFTIYSAQYATPPIRQRLTHPAHIHHAHDHYGAFRRSTGGISMPPGGASLLGMMNTSPFSGPLSLPLPHSSEYLQTIRNRQHHHHHHTYPPYPPVPRPPPRRLHYHPHGPQSNLHIGAHDHPPPPPPPAGRWDEDPCFLRPHSPETPCPHNLLGSSLQQEDGSCFVVMGHLESNKVPVAFSAKNPLHVERHLRQDEEEEGVYSYAGEGFVCPADVIKAQAALEDSDSYGGSIASENIYEEIPENWNVHSWARRSLVEEVLDEYERVRAGHRRVLSALNLDVETLIRPSAQNGTASPDSGLTVSASDSSCEPNPSSYDMLPNNQNPANPGRYLHRKSTSRKEDSDSSKANKRGRLVKCESLDLKDAFVRRPSGGRGQGFREKLGGVKEKMEKRGWRFPNFTKKDLEVSRMKITRLNFTVKCLYT